MLVVLQSWSMSQALLIAQALVFVVLLVVAVFYALKLGSVKAWKETAEQRKETISDLKAEIAQLEKRLAEAERRRGEAEDRSNSASQYNFELQGKVRVYERRFGPLNPEDSHSGG